MWLSHGEYSTVTAVLSLSQHAVQLLIDNSQSKVEEYRRKSQASENQESRSAKFLSKLMPPFAQDSISPSKFFRKKS
jgi:hypothetical protein